MCADRLVDVGVIAPDVRGCTLSPGRDKLAALSPNKLPYKEYMCLECSCRFAGYPGKPSREGYGLHRPAATEASPPIARLASLTAEIRIQTCN